MLSQFIRRILGAAHFPLRETPLADIEPQVYQPPTPTQAPAPAPPTP